MKTTNKTASQRPASRKAKKEASQKYNIVLTTNKIPEYRKEKGLRQVDLAQIIGCDSVTISRYERGLREPSLAYAILMAEYFNCPVEDIFGLKKKPDT